MNTPSAPPADEPRASIRMDARLDATTRGKVDAVSRRFHKPSAKVLSYIMQWALRHGQVGNLDQSDAQGPVRHLYLFVDPELHQRVEKAAITEGMKMAPWLRHMVRQMTITDFPASWQEERSEKRSHDSHTYGTRFMLRLDEPSLDTLQTLLERFAISKAQLIRQLLAQAKPENFPKRWHMKAAEHCAHQSRQDDGYRGHIE